jgi:prepilin-type N-terminal cleavage/methylation domain-containing protein
MELKRRRGFTILEILIAIVILVLGISGIVALFPTAIEAGNKTVEDCYAAAITQSVVDAIAVGIRVSQFRVLDRPVVGRAWKYFILNHDGVYDRMVKSPQNFQSDPNISHSDWCILLPQGPDPNVDPTKEPWFVYPSCPQRSFEIGDGSSVTLPGPYDNHAYQNLINLGNVAVGDDYSVTFQKMSYAQNPREIWIRRVYMLGRYAENQNPSGVPPRGIRDEFLGDAEGIGVSTTTPPQPGANYQNRPRIDPYPQYSFAIMLRRAKIDNCGATAGSPPDGLIGAFDSFSSSLYEVHVLVFRNFDGTGTTQQAIASGQRVIPRTNVPLREFVTLLSM